MFHGCCYLDLDKASSQLPIGRPEEMNHPAAGLTALPLIPVWGRSCFLFHQYGKALANKPLQGMGRQLILQGLQALQTLGLDLLVNLAGHAAGPYSWT